MTTKITCPNCHFEFDADEALERDAKKRLEKQLRDQLTAEYERRQTESRQAFEADFAARWQAEHELAERTLTEKLKSQQAMLEKMRTDSLAAVAEKEKLLLERQNLQLDLEKRLAEAKTKAAAQAADQISAARRELEAEREKIASQTAKQLADERALLEEQRAKFLADAAEKVAEDHRLKLAEKDKKIADFERQIATMQRQIDQGSQQTQGEVLELELETALREAFADDLIEPIPKGVNGADIRQRVFNTHGRECGKIVWESKRTKAWNEAWVGKLKNDMRQEKADLAVLVSTALPKTITQNFAFYQGLWLCTPTLATFVAQLLRFNLIRVSYVLASQENKDEKMEMLFRYLTGPEFVSKIETQLEAVAALRSELDHEKAAMLKNFAKREQQLARLQESVVTMYGGLQGVTQNALPVVKQLELEG